MNLLAKRSMRMTEGNIWKQIILFAVPMLIGNLFQQLYNTVDSMVVGNYVSTQALAAVGSVGPAINTLLGFFIGLSTGAGVVISRYFGAQDSQNLHDAVHTTMLLSLLAGVLMTVLGVLITPYLLQLMATPDDVMDDATLYLRIYFAGILGLMVYNMGSGVLRAVGDSQRPLLFLIITSVINVVLDLFFVLVFHMGIEGVALATILSQFISAGLVVRTLMRTTEDFRLILRDLRLIPHILRDILRIGMPAGLQMAVTSFSNVIVQSYINSFGSACMAGYSAYNKIDQFIMLPMQSIALASTTFVGQNLGAGKLKRAKKGTRISLLLAISCTAVLTGLLLCLARPLLMMFSSEGDVLAYGSMFIFWLSPCYVLCCFNQVLSGAMRGAGDSTAPMVIMLLSFVVFRQLYLFVGTQYIHSALFVGMGYPAGWLLCSILVSIYYFTGRWERHYHRPGLKKEETA